MGLFNNQIISLPLSSWDSQSHHQESSSHKSASRTLSRLPATSSASHMMRRQGSDLSIAYSLGSHYNTPLREAMAVWEEDLAAAGRESSLPSVIGTSDDPPGASGSVPSKDVPMGYLRRVSLAPISTGVPRVARTNLPVELPGRTYQPAPLTEQLSSSPSLNCSIAGQSSYCRGSTTVLNQSFSESIGRSQRTFLDAGQADHKETCLDIVPTNGHSFNGLATSSPPKLKTALKSKHLRRLLWVGLTLISLTAVAATVLLILDRTGRLSWETVKDRITSAAKSVGSWFQSNFSHPWSTAAVLIVSIGSAAIAMTALACAIKILRHRARVKAAAEISTAVHTEPQLHHKPNAELQSVRSTSTDSLGLIHYNCDYLLPSAPQIDTPPEHSTAAAAEPLDEDGWLSRGGRVDSGHDRYRGVVSTLVPVLPAEAVVRRIPTLTPTTPASTPVPVSCGSSPPRTQDGRRKAS